MHVDPSLAAEYRRRGWWGDTTVGEAVAQWARQRPDAAAYVAGAARVSWTAYDAWADAVADRIVATGLDRGARVAVWMPDGPAVHAVYVGAERAGVTVVGVGDRAGDQELRHLLRKTGASAIVTAGVHRGRSSAAIVDELRRDGVRIDHHLVVDEEPLPRPSAARAGPSHRYGPDDVFMINSTSGTTGMPKCVLHTQNRWMFFHQLATAAADLTANDTFLSALPAPFGFGLWTAHVTPAVLGATTVVAPRFDAEQTLRAIERERVTVLACVSTQFLMLLSAPAFGSYDLTSLRCMFTGGEAVPYDAAARFEDATGASVLQFYGSNETGALSCTTRHDDREHRLRTAGRPIDEMQVRLLDDDGADITAPGAPGHPVCKGPAMCIGYLDDDAANEALFTPDGWMRIGDICEFDDDGYLRVVGRTSDVVIRGGKNISAAVVEAEVATHDAVALVAVVAVPDAVFGERVCACVELRAGANLTLDDVTTHLEQRGVSKEWFPEYLVVLDELPRASGGKVAKGALRDDVRRRFAATDS